MSHITSQLPFWEKEGLPAPGTPITAEAYVALPETVIRMERINGVVYYPFADEETTRHVSRPDHQ